MKRIIHLAAIVLLCSLLLSGCIFGGTGGGSNMVGPRTEDAWKKWEEQQKVLQETWGETEVYAYLQTILEDLGQVNANVIFTEDFSLEKESKERDAFLKMYDDMNVSEDYTPEEFLTMLKDSSFRYVVGGMHELDSIEERKEEDGGGYHAVILYYPNHESLMPVDLTITKDKDGKFSLIETFRED